MSSKVRRLTGEKFFRAIKENGGVECQEYPNLYIPEDFVKEAVHADYKFLRMICNRCPVKDLCAEYAIELNPEYGMWAGMTPREVMRKHTERYGRAARRRSSELDIETTEPRDGTRQTEEGWGESDIRPMHLSSGDGPDWWSGSEDEILAWREDWDGNSLVA